MNYESLIQHMKETVPHMQDNLIEDWVYSAVATLTDDADLFEDYPTPKHRQEAIEKRVRWHMRRMNGIGGSDMSVLYTEYTGGFVTYGGDEAIDAASIISQKIGLVGLTGSTGDMIRGNKLESEARLSFERQMKSYGLKPHNAAYKKLEAFMKEGWDKHPWITSSPDAIYIDKNGETWLVDFKVPANVDNVNSYYQDPPLHYRAQLAQYKAHLEAAGVKIDHVALVPFSTKEWKSYVGEFDCSEEFIKDILECGDYYWDYVERNELPKRPPSQDFQFVDEMPPALKALMAEFIMASKMKSVATNKQESLKERILEVSSLSGVDWKSDGMKTRLPGVQINHTENKKRANSKAMSAKIKELGGDPEDPSLYTTSNTTSVSVVRGKKVPFYDFIADNQDVAEATFQDAMAEVKELGDFINAAPDDVRDPTEPDAVSEMEQKSKDAAFDELGF